MRVLHLKKRLLVFKMRLLVLKKRLFHLKMTLLVDKKRRLVFNVSLLPGPERLSRNKTPAYVDAKLGLPGCEAAPLSLVVLLPLLRPRLHAKAVLPSHWGRRDRGDFSR
jgi:hypothetical protein